jgi:hypothetical protein
MSSSFRRYEILLPLYHNDGSPVDKKLIITTVTELEDHFGAGSSETQTIHGFWRHKGKRYEDELTRIFVDVLDLPEHRSFFLDFKEQLKERFAQLEVRITTSSLEVL